MPITDERRAWYASFPDDAFPMHPSVWTNDSDKLLAEIPKAGNGLSVTCAGCWEKRWLGGQEICRRWPEWLGRPGIAWAKSLRCQHCDARRFIIACFFDPGSGGFQLGPEDTAPVVHARRLAAWIKDGPVTVYDLAPRLSAMPGEVEMRAAGL